MIRALISNGKIKVIVKGKKIIQFLFTKYI